MTWFKKLPPKAIRQMAKLALATFCLGAFVTITSVIVRGPGVPAFDLMLMRLVGEHRVSWLNSAAVDITALGSTAVIALLSVVGLVLLLMTRDRLDAMHLVLAAMGSGIWTNIIKTRVERARPTVIPRLVEVTDFSYPSGHSLTATAMYLTIAFIACRYVKAREKQAVVFALASLIIVLTAASRVYLGAHYPTDVISGISFGMAWALGLASALEFSRRQ